MNRRYWLGWIFFFATALLVYNLSEHSLWVRYFNGKIGDTPRMTFVKAYTYLGKPGHALSIGTGVGNDEAILLKHGWRVDCVEPHVKALEIIKSRSEFKQAGDRVKYIEKKVEYLQEQDLAKEYDFIYAGYSLPFIKPLKFQDSWRDIKSRLRKGGIFAGQFFGLAHKKLNVRYVTRLSRSEVREMFADLRLLLFNEEHKNGTHTYKVIAKK